MKNIVTNIRPTGGRVPRSLLRMASVGLCLAIGSSLVACNGGSLPNVVGGNQKVADTVSADQPYFSAKKLDFYQAGENESIYVMSTQYADDKVFVFVNATTYDDSFFEDMEAQKMAGIDPEAYAEDEIIVEETSTDESSADETVTDETVTDETMTDESFSEEEIIPQENMGYTTKYVLLTYSLTGELLSQTSFDNLFSADSSIITFSINSDGNLNLLYRTYDPETYEPSVLETVVDTAGKVIKEPTKFDMEKNFDPYTAVSDEAGNRYFMGYAEKSTLIVTDPSGKTLMKIADDSLGGALYPMNGKVYTTGYDQKNNYTFTLYEIDIANKKLAEGVDISFVRDMGMGFMTGPDGIYYDTETGIDKVDFDKKESKEVLSWSDCEIEHQSYGGDQVVVLSDTSFLLISNIYEEDKMTNTTTSYLLAKEASNPNAGKKIITVGGLSLSYDETLRKNIYDFNKNSTEYRIITKDYETDIDYSQFETAQDYMQAYSDMLNKMNLEITSGDGPDIIYGSFADFSLYESKGLLVDLYTLMEGDTSFKKDDLLPGILKACESDGKLYKLGASFSVVGLVGAKSVIGDRTGWTIEEFQQVADSLPEKMDMLSSYGYTQSNLLMNILSSSMSSFVDTGTGKVSFDTDDFRAIIKLAKDYGKDDDAIDDGSNYVDERELIRNGELALMNAYVSDLYGYHDVVSTFGEPVSFVGYPSSAKTGTSCYMDSMLAISSESPSVDGAWTFVKSFFTEEAQDSVTQMYTIPVLRSALEKSIQNVLDPKNNNNVYYGYDGQEASPITEESAAGYRALVDSVSVYAIMDPAILAIVQEEVAPYFNDQKTAEDVSKLIQNRVETIVKEKR